MAVLNITQFRELFPAFKDTVKYPDALIQMCWDLAITFISNSDCPYRTLSGDQLQAALNMLTAHILYTTTQSASGGSGGTKQGGFTTSATVGEVSVSKLAPPATDGWQFWLSGSPYGLMLWALLSMLAVGGFAIGGLPEREGFRKIGGVFL